MTSRTFTTKEVLALLEQQDVFENEEGCVDFNSESDDDGVHLTEGDFTLADGTQSLVDADLTYQYKLALSLSIFPRIRTIRNGLDVAFRQGSC